MAALPAEQPETKMATEWIIDVHRRPLLPIIDDTSDNVSSTRRESFEARHHATINSSKDTAAHARTHTHTQQVLWPMMEFLISRFSLTTSAACIRNTHWRFGLVVTSWSRLSINEVTIRQARLVLITEMCDRVPGSRWERFWDTVHFKGLRADQMGPRTPALQGLYRTVVTPVIITHRI